MVLTEPASLRAAVRKSSPSFGMLALLLSSGRGKEPGSSCPGVLVADASASGSRRKCWPSKDWVAGVASRRACLSSRSWWVVGFMTVSGEESRAEVVVVVAGLSAWKLVSDGIVDILQNGEDGDGGRDARRWL